MTAIDGSNDVLMPRAKSDGFGVVVASAIILKLMIRPMAVLTTQPAAATSEATPDHTSQRVGRVFTGVDKGASLDW